MATVITRLPVQVNLVLYAGDDFTFVVRLFNADGTPADLTGAAVKAQVRASVTATDVLGQLAPTVDEPNGLIWLHLEDDVSATLPRTGVWDCQVTLPPDDVFTPVAGTITMTPDVTRP